MVFAVGVSAGVQGRHRRRSVAVNRPMNEVEAATVMQVRMYMLRAGWGCGILAQLLETCGKNIV